MNIVITGANRGLGLGLVRHYLAQGHDVWACCRQLDQAHALHGLQSPQLHLVLWDVSLDHVPACSWPSEVHLLINNAGIYGPTGDGQSLASVAAACMLDVFNTDAIGPLRVVQHLLSSLRRGHAVIANISSKMGSVSDNGSGGTYAYRAAKTALIMISKSMAIDLGDDGIHVLSLHPGWVQTDMTHHTGLIDINTSVQGMTTVIEQARNHDSGSFIAFDGQKIEF